MDDFITFNSTCLGYVHQLKGKICQDYSCTYKDNRGRFQIAVVADGHGDSKCFRSDKGSKFACEVALDCLAEFAEVFLREIAGDSAETKLDEDMIRHLTDTIISKWTEKTLEDLKYNPISEEKYEISSGKNTNRLPHIYGTTLIAVLHVDNFYILIQQGDGRCVVLFEDGEISEPIPWDERCYENVTTSMCDFDACFRIRHKIINCNEKDVTSVFLGCDGVEDSFSDIKGRHIFFENILCDVLVKSEAGLQRHFEESLAEFSKNGSGDDISIAGIINPNSDGINIQKFRDDYKIYLYEDNLKVLKNKINSMKRKYEFLKKRAEKARVEVEKLSSSKIIDKKNAELELINSLKEFVEYSSKYKKICGECQEIELKIAEFNRD